MRGEAPWCLLGKRAREESGVARPLQYRGPLEPLSIPGSRILITIDRSVAPTCVYGGARALPPPFDNVSLPFSSCQTKKFAAISLLAAVPVAIFTTQLSAQDSVQVAGSDSGPTGRIVGRIIDQASGAGVSDAYIQVVGTRSGAKSRNSFTGAPIAFSASTSR